MTGNALSIRGLTKTFRGKLAVDDVTLSVARGEILGFLGPNGAGKTTVMNMVMGLVEPDAGEIDLFGVRNGFPRSDVRLRIGFLQEKPRIYPEMTARAYLRFFAALHGVGDPDRRVVEVLERVGLTAAADRRLSAFSRGMQQRTCLGRVMLHRPEFLLLDEPTLGLDPNGVADMRAIFRDMKSEGATLLFSSHQLAEMERVCDSVIFMRQGRVIASGHQSALLPAEAAQGAFTVELFDPVYGHLDTIRALPGVATVRERATNSLDIVLTAPAKNVREARADIARMLAGAHLTVLSIGAASPTLEDLFIGLTGPGSDGRLAPTHRNTIEKESSHGSRI